MIHHIKSIFCLVSMKWKMASFQLKTWTKVCYRIHSVQKLSVGKVELQHLSLEWEVWMLQILVTIVLHLNA